MNSNTALVIVDMQKDFVWPSGALPVPGAVKLVPIINELKNDYATIIFTKDWHPTDHCSFSSWPVHCVRHSYGSDLHESLVVLPDDYVVHKGTNKDKEEYSGFNDETDGIIRVTCAHRAIETVHICGVALEYCVKATALAAKEYGFNVAVLASACAAVDDGDEAIGELVAAGVSII